MCNNPQKCGDWQEKTIDGGEEWQLWKWLLWLWFLCTGGVKFARSHGASQGKGSQGKQSWDKWSLGKESQCSGDPLPTPISKKARTEVTYATVTPALLEKAHRLQMQSYLEAPLYTTWKTSLLLGALWKLKMTTVRWFPSPKWSNRVKCCKTLFSQVRHCQQVHFFF